jgi:hypothetical protein
MQEFQNDYFLSSDTIDDEEGFDVAMLYPIQDTTPRIPPTAIKTDSCKTIGLHSDSIKRYA